MSFAYEGLDAKIKHVKISTFISPKDPLIQLSNLIDWEEVKDIIISDLKSSTAKGFWERGRKMYLRSHLGVFFLQALFNYKDREVERLICLSPLYQVFCGQSSIKKWKCPDATKVETFRNRLSPITQKNLNDYILLLAKDLKYTDPSQVDIDSTTQEANMAYPSDANLMKKLALKCKKTFDYMKEKGKRYLPENCSIDIKGIIKKSQEYFFLAQNSGIEKKRKIFKDYHTLVKKNLMPFIKFAEELSPKAKSHLPWNHRKSIEEIEELGRRYLLDVAHFIRTHTIKTGKALSFNLRDVICINKGKPGKDREFGRRFQVGRLKGNFLAVYTCTGLDMNDKLELQNLLKEHEEIFGKEVIDTVTTDKGYYSRDNIKYVKENIGSAVGIQRPINPHNAVPLA